MLAGGYESEGELSSEVMIFNISLLSGYKVKDLPMACASSNLLYYAKKNLVFIIGGLQSKLNDSNIDEFFDYKGCDFWCYDISTEE